MVKAYVAINCRKTAQYIHITAFQQDRAERSASENLIVKYNYTAQYKGTLDCPSPDKRWDDTRGPLASAPSDSPRAYNFKFCTIYYDSCGRLSSLLALQVPLLQVLPQLIPFYCFHYYYLCCFCY